MGGKSLEACRDVVYSGTRSEILHSFGREGIDVDKPVERRERLCGEGASAKETSAALDRVVNGYCRAHLEIRDCKIEKVGKVDVHEIKPQMASKEPSAWQRVLSLFAKAGKPGMY